MPMLPGLVVTRTADTAVGELLSVVMSDSNAENVMLPGSAGALKFFGITLYDADTNKKCSIQISGIARMKSGGGGHTAGDYITHNTAGKAVTVASIAFGGSTTLQVIGIALNTVAATANLIVDVLIQPFTHRP